MTPGLEVLPSAEEAARRAAQVIAEELTAAAAAGPASVAFSGGTTPMPMLRALAGAGLPWHGVAIFQVDERVAPPGDPGRNLTGLLAALPPEAHDSLRPMPVEDPDLEEAAARYARQLPDVLDLVHLGLGADGHTASLVPGDAVLEVDDRAVALTGEYEGHRRMTLTFPALDHARRVLWLVTGADKRAALERLLARDTSIPAARVACPSQLVVADAAAAARA